MIWLVTEVINPLTNQPTQTKRNGGEKMLIGFLPLIALMMRHIYFALKEKKQRQMR